MIRRQLRQFQAPINDTLLSTHDSTSSASAIVLLCLSMTAVDMEIPTRIPTV